MFLGVVNTCINRIQFSSVAQSCPTLCDPMNRSTPGLPVHHQLPEFKLTSIESVMPSSHLIWTLPKVRFRPITPQISQEYMKRFITYIKRLSVENRAGFPTWSDKWLEREEKEADLEFLWWLENDAGITAPTWRRWALVEFNHLIRGK